MCVSEADAMSVMIMAAEIAAISTKVTHQRPFNQQLTQRVSRIDSLSLLSIDLKSPLYAAAAKLCEYWTTLLN